MRALGADRAAIHNPLTCCGGEAGWVCGTGCLNEQPEVARMIGTVDSKIEAEDSRRWALEALFNTPIRHLMAGKLYGKDLAHATG